jgi:hypothetical protein
MDIFVRIKKQKKKKLFYSFIAIKSQKHKSIFLQLPKEGGLKLKN